MNIQHNPILYEYYYGLVCDFFVEASCDYMGEIKYLKDFNDCEVRFRDYSDYLCDYSDDLNDKDK